MKRLAFMLLSFFISGYLFSQQVKVVKDFGFWGGFNVEKKLSKAFEINLEQQMRFYSAAKKLDDYIINLGGKYIMNKNFKLGANLRYTYNSKLWTEADNNCSYNLDLLYKGDVSKRMTIFYRVRYQHEYVNLLSDYHSSNVHYSIIRNKIETQYSVGKSNKPYVSVELFKLIEMYKIPHFNKIRFYLGDNIKTNIGKFDCAIGYEQEINTKYPLSFLFLKTIYTLKL